MLSVEVLQSELDRLRSEYDWIDSLAVFEVVAATGGWQVDFQVVYRRRQASARRAVRNRALLVAGADAPTVARQLLAAVEERTRPRQAGGTSTALS